ncbi:MAG TPA: radical SAM protein [Candidatus Aminicenantes bacterium]|nr:radical SAM protein [Candidatus Aminicenantes bacterium]HRY63925.1 radical SAM protein [Candidatus Aminicenantes bacterium]HRZ70838.1 radical SAM protein [Candidatus Aminicenantes bacterium]
MGEGGRIFREKGEIEALRRRQDAGGPGAKTYWVAPGPDGRLPVPAELAAELGLDPGARLEVVVDRGRVEALPNIHSLRRLYIEPTSRCNLSCRTCIRNTWEEPIGDMDEATFGRVAGQLSRFPHLETVMFGGFGEPTAHPRILDMVRAVKALGLRAEMTTNATLLDEALIEGLLRERLDTLWVSLDGTTEASFETIREGASFPLVLENVERLAGRNGRDGHAIEIGIAFVVMKTNFRDVKHLDRLARSVGARRIMVSHVLPYSEEMEKEMLCLQTLTLETFTFAPGKVELSLPRIDVNNATKDTFFSLFQGFENLTFMGNRIAVDARRCRFVRERTSFVRWDGRVAPCMGLLHSHRTYLYGLERKVRSHAFGDARLEDLFDIWNSKPYADFREKVKAFDYSPCHVCGGCSMLESNEEDCYGNAFPACGGCLWAQGVIQCP